MTKKTKETAVNGHALRIEDTKRDVKLNDKVAPHEADWADTRHLLFSTSA
ncbi:hypothetical protein [Thioclava indica]|uniref:Uncharacterized protein n=1 Tax=Thioclava indica TaxID=1353528 RepID=A0A074K0T7_9RHOB|nr:hypothetical protein [Thioclava indica]KEO61820.1 hypothetical protein DT23_02260 [Thioclava indica]